jgi:hypothetical protein
MTGHAKVRAMVTDAAWDRFHAALDTLAQRVRGDEEFADELYAALCNMRGVHQEVEGPVSVSWRHAGGVAAGLRGKDDAERASASYLDCYCSGGEGRVSDRVAAALGELGWTRLPWPADPLA